MVLSKFESLFVRPPTPPKDVEDSDKDVDVDETVQFLEDPFGEKPAQPRAVVKVAAKKLLNTPDQSPSSDISIPSSSAKKRVNFEVQTCVSPHKKAVIKSWTPTRSSPLRPLPQTRVSLPLKSILKPTDAASTPIPNDEGAAAHQFKSFAEMLESIVKQLAQGERPSRLDAYHSLQRTMQAYDKIPDEQALKNKMSLLAQFIRRDTQAISPTGSGLDSQLIGQALKLLLALFRIPDLSAAMDDEFSSYMVERSIQVLTDVSVSKSVVNTHLAMLMQQNFRPKIMTGPRVEKIMDGLDTIQDRVKGFSVQAYRLRIYRKLIQQRPDLMIRHTERWFKHTFKALVSTHKDIYQSALDTAIAAAKLLGHDRSVAKSVLTVLNKVRSDGETTLAKVMAQELQKMLDGDNPSLVPQIWSAVTGLLRDHFDIKLFTDLEEWLKVFEKALKSENDQVKIYGNIAYGFLLYAVNPSEETAKVWSKFLLNVPLQQFQRRGSMKKSERDAIFCGYNTLLYYAFRPTASHEQLDRFWTEFVVGFWTPVVHQSAPIQAALACRHVSALLSGSRNPWDAQRALDLRFQVMTQLSEVPLVDPRWVRRSIGTVLKFVETLLDTTAWSNGPPEDDPIKNMWSAVLDSLVEASSKEVMASTESKDAMAHIVNLLRRVWDRHTAQLAVPQHKEDSWADKFCFLVESVVQKLGALRFVDKCLTRNSQDEFEVASTPSFRSRLNGTRTSPLLYFVDLLMNQSEGKLSDSIRLRAMKLVLEPGFNAQNTRLSKLELLRDCATIVDGSIKAAVALDFWSQTARLLKLSIEQQVPDPNERESRQLGKEYEVTVELLNLGSDHLLRTSQGLQVLSAFITTVRKEAGDGALVLAVIERVSESVLASVTDKCSCLPYTSTLLQNLPSKTISRRVLDQGRQTLWPSSPAGARNHDFDPYNHLYSAVNSAGSAAYDELGTDNVESTRTFLVALGVSIKSCSTSLLAVYLRKVQEVIRTWVEDPQRKLQNKAPVSKTFQREVVSLWREVNEAIERLPRKDSQVLLHLEPLITSGFVSRRRKIVNISIATWNKTFGKEENLRYPPRLEKVLRRLHKTVDLALPSWVTKDTDSDAELSLYDSDESTEGLRRSARSSRVKESPYKIIKSARDPKHQSPTVSSPASRRTSSRRTPKVRLRHDNSQIQFEAIVSSPSNPFVQESQILTERQKEMIERQRLAGGLFADMRALSPQREAPPSPLELHSDLQSVEDLPSRTTRTTPLKTLAKMGPMDVFLHSSPTPHARRTSQKIVSDDTDVATPTAVRTVRVAEDEDLGSSPPRFEGATTSKSRQHPREAAESLEDQQPDSVYSASFDDGTTMDEDALAAAVMLAEQEEELTKGYELSDDMMSDLPSSTIDLELTAQIDADIQTAEGAIRPDETIQEPESVFVDAASHPTSSHNVPATQDGSDTEVEPTPKSFRTRKGKKADTSSTSRVEDSFTSTPAKGTPGSHVRRSTRQSMDSPIHIQLSNKKRQKNPRRSKQESTLDGQASSPLQAQPEAAGGELENGVAASPTEKTRRGKKRKAMADSPSRLESPGVTLESGRRNGMRRSQSNLSQVESATDVITDTPAPFKRVRQSTNKDVSEAKLEAPLPPRDLHSSHNKRLSHVQVTPRHDKASAPAVEEQIAASIATVADTAPELRHSALEQSQIQSQQQAPTGSATPNRSFAERVILTPRSIINKFKEIKNYILNARGLTVSEAEVREIDDVLFHIRRGVFAAGQGE
ncbi:Rap1-interacting factor 1 N terminal-domain-containing protein [Boeremia exigua]|uniref:Rap1-interacting factor 1 N terminal-domain-containing protein n=1 Tax=Boeremia exigua TaxID=749465 RepID=UPI001E8DE5ED|nr:Rap1-interacting factor 1 N terminal-domain-containing protein [Boeremia exigua]KAH6633064.1 Rap1-interacting factor 1 N terminal-domain-containing protein [Boeremia exigua]